MIILILLLIWVLVSYYKEDPFTATPSNPVTVPPIEEPIDNNVIIDEKENRNDEEDPNSSVENNGENEVQEPLDGNNESTEPALETNDKPGRDWPPTSKDPVVMESADQTSNREKQEVLTEIDKTLMELLQVVDKVQPIDETRLGIDESEVQ